MNIIITPRLLTGSVHAVPSKSYAHRFLICAAFSDGPSEIICPETNDDIEVTAACLTAMGANIQRTEQGYLVSPATDISSRVEIFCRESGATLRFLLPILGALGVSATIHMEGRLSHRPLSPLWEEMERMGCVLSKPSPDVLLCSGKLCAGSYSLPGNISSQFISGLLFAMALMEGKSQLSIVGMLSSAPYVNMTREVLSVFGVDTSHFVVQGSYPFHSTGTTAVEGDWSNAAFFLTANAIGNPVLIDGLNDQSLQGDRMVVDILDQLKASRSIVSAVNIPDLIPILSVYAACMHGCVFTDIERLRLKESDRVKSTVSMLQSLSIRAEATETTLTVYPGHISGGIVDSFHDHRIAMSAAIAATKASSPVTILDAECVSKSYPSFWKVYKRLGGSYEQLLR